MEAERRQRISTCKAFAADLWMDGKYREIVSLIEEARPGIPAYNFRDSNIEEMKYRSAQRELHDLIMKILKPTEK
jgi:hypothetical protein